ncbi:preprotein translocase subunit SecF [Candidatus Kinetoplastibacterium desouzaii TCC079E]|uniref:Protein-export membrane protein SecF n=1 Tax=Candidatus Kinetoplastidibacterium desouzai TCC079E TaxID=1208919 RepID=M1M326_9PROT|nr:protein translocase subunit SecF [Candidatus Kinetoplastibacterium desouzaii]AGF46675.1 preprotein translocase subunit SecF [Candidatus Kinetoplastibacterium desouzaii TCC079E]
MELFRISKTIPFMRHAVLLNLVSLITFITALFFIQKNGLNLSTEFTGGSVIEASYTGNKIISLDKIRESFADIDNYDKLQIQYFGSSKEIMIKIPTLENNSEKHQINEILSRLQKHEKSFQINKIEIIGPQVGEKLARDGLLALTMVIIGIITYLSFRFEWRLAVSGVIANLHDVTIILGFFAFFHWEFSLAVLAGILAVLGYSVNESVIIMDRIRENCSKDSDYNVEDIINKSITQTISRTIITHTSTQFMVLSLFFFGGHSLHYFSIALTIGIWFGIYSSIFISASLAMWLNFKGNKNISKKNLTINKH